jgi:hypothetical protein
MTKRRQALPKGVSRFRGKFQAAIRIGHGYQHLGTFDTIEDAAAAYRAAEWLRKNHAGEVTDQWKTRRPRNDWGSGLIAPLEWQFSGRAK